MYATSAALRVAPDADVEVKGRKRFVSRGGHKLQGALDAFGQDVRGMRCLDIGSSTAASPIAAASGRCTRDLLDVNYGQLAWSLRQDARVTAFERTNVKHADPAALGAPFDLLVADLSFIASLRSRRCFARFCGRERCSWAW